ncbi:hypothetical protein HZA44_02505 [Candidatus Peregrinibacteria bacterium]|nr:hypothetical protein [Candidatus Peregrinibacteria bacterium]
MQKPYRHRRRQADQHHEAHQRVKWLLARHAPRQENVWTLFFATFIGVLLTLLLYRNWGVIVEWLKPEPQSPAPIVETQGIKTGVVAVGKIDAQAGDEEKKRIAEVETVGGAMAIETTEALAKDQAEKPVAKEDILKNAMWVTNYLSRGQHLTKLDQTSARALQKSVLATYYFGEKTVDIYSTLQMDTKLLSQISNTLSVDLFQYLNQSANRADALSGYLNLLGTLKKKSDERITDLQYKIAFLSSNAKGQEAEVRIDEKAFFDNLKIFSGSNAEDQLAQFIGLRQQQAETKAKWGAYDSLKRYYEFFRPKLDNLSRAITLNRDALIAGVKVVEIQNMALPLIIRQR